MISLRLAVPVVLVAAAVAACFTYLVTPPPAVEVYQPKSPNLKGQDTRAPTNTDQHPNAEEQAAAAFKRASTAILRQLPEAQASARTNELPITGPIPLPKRRPIPSAATP
jgi:hypothetical protein